MVTLEQVLARVAVGNENAEQRGELRRVVLETIAACGLLVNTKTGEVYDPAPRFPTKSVPVPRQQNVRWVGGRRR